MTWRTSRGERTLKGSEAALVREALACLVDMATRGIDDDLDGMEFGIPMFDRLQPFVKLAVLVDVGWALLKETEVCPELTAINEAAVAAIFGAASVMVQYEVDSERFEAEEFKAEDFEAEDFTAEDFEAEGFEADDSEGFQDPFFWRKLMLDVLREDGESEDLPAADCMDHEEWQSVLELLSNRILWDNDYNSADPFLDAAPDEAKRLRQEMGIDDNYFLDVPPDPRTGDLAAIRRRLRQLLNDTASDS